MYRSHWAECDVQNIDIDRIHELPVLTKDMVRRNGDGALAEGSTTTYLQHTSGTTGEPLLVHRNQAEVSNIAEFFGSVRSEAATGKHQPIFLSMANVVHGTATPMPSSAFVINGACYDEATCNSTRSLLLRGYSISGFESRVSAISGPLEQLIYFTQYLIECGIDPRDVGLKFVSVYSSNLSPVYYHFLKEHWGSLIANYYSLTEIFGGARSINGEPFEFDIHVIPEILQANGKPSPPGAVGRLVLTSLYPFVQRQPFIRYETGDLASYTGDADFRVSIHGRNRGTLFHPSDEGVPLILAADIGAVIDNYPQIWGQNYAASIPIFNKGVFKSTRYIGNVSCTRGKPSQIRIGIEISPEPSLGTCSAQDLSFSISSGILERSPRLAVGVSRGEFTLHVDVLASGSLSALPVECLDRWSVEFV